MPELSIIIPTKDRGDIFYKTYQQVLESSAHLDVEILIINNSHTPVVISSKPVHVFVHDNPNNKNSVFSSRNYGASLAKASIILFMDDDILATKESLEYVLLFHAKHFNACLNVNWVYPTELIEEIRKTVFGRYLIKQGFTAMKSLYGEENWQDDKSFITKSLASFFYSIRKEDFIKVGGYDERHLHEGTDIDISNRLNRAGIEIWINPLILVYHNETDRVEILNWLERKKRLGVIYKHSTEVGMEAHRQTYSISKRVGFKCIYFLQPLLIRFITLFNLSLFDTFTFRCIDVLLGANIYTGYYTKS